MSPTMNNIDGLKDAAKAKKHITLKDVEADTLKVFVHDADMGVWAEVPTPHPPVSCARPQALICFLSNAHFSKQTHQNTFSIVNS